MPTPFAGFFDDDLCAERGASCDAGFDGIFGFAAVGVREVLLPFTLLPRSGVESAPFVRVGA
ncbi:MAG: hypothetical protein ACOC0P_07070 [Planctomycetota bacterium]